MDYSGNWKMSHNMIKSTFEKLLVTSYFTNGTFNVWAVNDGLTPIVDAQICIRLYQFNQTTDSAQVEHCVTANLTAASSVPIYSEQNSQLFSSKCPATNCFVRVIVSDSPGGKQLAITHNWPIYLKDTDINSTSQPNPTVSVEDPGTNSQVLVTVTNTAGTSCPSIFTSLQSGSIIGFFSENVFVLLPGESKQVTFTAKHLISSFTLAQELME